MKRAKIKYRKVGDRIKVTGFADVADGAELAERYGDVVADEYLGGDGECFIAWDPEREVPEGFSAISVGDVGPKEFEAAVATMKAAGHRLERLVAESGEKEILI